MPVRITIEKNIRSNKEGFECFSFIYQQIIDSNSKEIVLDFKKNVWFDANLSAILGAVIERVRRDGFSVIPAEIQSNVSNVFNRNGFMSLGNTKAPIKTSDPEVSYRRFRLDENEIFSNYIDSELLSKDAFPKQSKGLKRKMIENIFEIFGNAKLHGRCDGIYTCGHCYPKNELNTRSRLDFTMVDIGNTFLENVNYYMNVHHKPLFDCPHEAIAWAMIKGNTTKIEHTGGLGLGLLLEFLELNNGRMQVVSDKGFWEYNGATRKKNDKDKLLSSKFPGTIVNIEFNIDDTNFYSLTTETVPVNNIF